MKKLLLLTLVFLSMQLFASDFNFSISGKNYKLIKTKKTWVDAAAWAVQDGGYLVEINSASEQQGIVNAIVVSGVSTTYTVVNDGGGIAYIWIGATDKGTEGTWLWDGDNDGQGANFYTGQGAWGNGTGAVINGLYNNWGGSNTGTNNEPDDYGSSQDAAGIGLDAWPMTGSGNVIGEWNDIDKSNTLYFIVEYDGVGINEDGSAHIIPELNIFQNGDGLLNIQSGYSIQEIEIFNIEGKRVFHINGLNVQSFVLKITPSSGVYFIRSRFVDEAIRSKKVFIR